MLFLVLSTFYFCRSTIPLFHVEQFNFVCFANKKIKLPTTNDKRPVSLSPHHHQQYAHVVRTYAWYAAGLTDSAWLDAV